MPLDRALPSDGIPEATHFAEAQTGTQVELQSQLSSPKDITAASNFFKSSGANTFLPDMPVPRGVEAALLPPGVESAIGLPAMPGAGAEQVSPLINMITKMPGHIGLLSNFFEFLGSFFGGPDLLSAFDQGLGGDLLSGIMDGAGDHLGIDLSLLPDDAPILETLGDASGFGGALGDALPSGTTADWSSTAVRPLGESFANAPTLNVNGGVDVGKPAFEHGLNLNFDPNNHFRSSNLVAMDPTGGFSSTITPTQAVPQGLPDNSHLLPQGPVGQSPAAGTDGSGVTGDGQAADAGQGDAQGQDPAAIDGQSADGASTEGADGSDKAAATVNYKVQSGDNLWDIAGKHLGDSTRWGEIYKLNEGLIGQNPRLIMPGTELQLPGGATADGVASADIGGDYTVQSGDNLWDISKSHLGGGSNWKDLYAHNTEVIGGNPDLIHPGQHLQMTDAAHPSGHLAGSQHLSHAVNGAHGSHVASHSANHAAHSANSSAAHNASVSTAHSANSPVTHSVSASADHSSTASELAHPKIAQVNHSASGEGIAPVELEAQATTMTMTD